MLNILYEPIASSTPESITIFLPVMLEQNIPFPLRLDVPKFELDMVVKVFIVFIFNC
jgi:hypothetical protein